MMNTTGKAIAVAVALLIATVTYVTIEKATIAPSDLGASNTVAASASPLASANGPVTGFASVRPILELHCVGCHSATPTMAGFAAAPLGIMLDSYEHAAPNAARIQKVTVDTQVMPLGNMTNMTFDERKAIADWISEGAPR